jgi:Negative regulator of sigma F
MTANDRNRFIREIAAGHKPVRTLWQPGPRTAVWFAVVLVVTTVAMLLRQEFRPGFAGQLVQHPVLLAEVVSALALTVLAAYAALVNAVPGARVPRPAVAATWVAGAVFAVGLATEFTVLAPESSTLGSRPHCWIEVFIYGAAGTWLMVILARRGWVRFNWLHGAGYGIAAVVPAALMQLACMYEPVHNMLYHFLPIIPVLGLGLFLMKRLAGHTASS